MYLRRIKPFGDGSHYGGDHPRQLLLLLFNVRRSTSPSLCSEGPFEDYRHYQLVARFASALWQPSFASPTTAASIAS
jgi:hypothetical protein